MTLNGLLQIALFFTILLSVTKPLGLYMARVYQGHPSWLSTWFGPLERGIYRLCSVRSEEEMDWNQYAQSLLLFSAFGMAALYLLLRFQQYLPLNPHHFGPLPPDLAFNTAASYVSNTNWQAYAGESTMSHLSQMAGLTAQDFMSSAAAMGALMALIRGLVRRGVRTVGNFWVDLVRSILYILLPLAIVSSLVLISQGAVQSLTGSVPVQWLQPRHYDQPVQGSGGQMLALGPAATQVIARDLGTSGGGFFSANSAHPFESPTPFSDLLLLLVQTVVAAGLTYTYGKMVGDTRQGWAILSVMLVVLSVGVAITYQAESAGNPRIQDLGVDVSITGQQSGGNYGRQGSPVWDCPDGIGGIRHDGNFHRSAERHAGLLHADRGTCAACDDAIRRGDSGWDRLGTQRDDRSGHHRRVHFRADGRPHAGIFRQEIGAL